MNYAIEILTEQMTLLTNELRFAGSEERIETQKRLKDCSEALNNLSLGGVSGSLTSGDVERINRTPINNFIDWLVDNNKVENSTLLWSYMETYIKGVVQRFKEAEKVNGR